MQQSLKELAATVLRLRALLLFAATAGRMKIHISRLPSN